MINQDNARQRSTKEQKYAFERQAIYDRICNILNITDTNSVVDLRLLDQDIDRQNQIIALADETRKYFKTGNWVYYTKTATKPYLSLAKSIIKESGHKIVIVHEISTGKSIKKGLKIV